MKKYIAPLLCAAVLWGCSEIESGSVSEEASVTEYTETVDISIEAETASVTDTIAEESVTTTDSIEYNYSLTVNENSVNVMRNGDVIQTLDCTPYSENMLISEDYNFDRYDDLFVITDIQDVKLSGIYFKFNTETALFEEWSELNNIGHTLDIGMSSNLSIGQVLSYSTSNPDAHETFIYKWENDKLILVERRITIIYNENNTAVTELYYIDDNGNEILIESAERDLNEHPLDFD